MTLNFSKYHGTGNDFILIDDMGEQQQLREEQIKFLCHRRFGIGADGLILLRPSAEAHFKMVYYNSDGRLSTMCGNGGRCLAHFAWQGGHAEQQMRFEAIDGLHRAELLPSGEVKLQMGDAPAPQPHGNDWTVDTGSPHFLRFCPEDPGPDFITLAQSIRQAPPFAAEGINVNFLWFDEQSWQMRTFERGVESETYSCGTGATAAALLLNQHQGLASPVKLGTPGGELQVEFERTDGGYQQVFLLGPAQAVYRGSIEL